MKPSIKKIRNLCTESSFERGLDYFKEGMVENVEQFGNKVTATVSGTYDYKVTIRTDKDDFDADCTCPYDWGGYCKHIIAVLLLLSEKTDEVRDKKEKIETKIYNILDNVTLNELKEFLIYEFENSPDLRNKFSIYFSGRGEDEGKSIHDYKKEINLLYRELGGRYGYMEYRMEVDFSHINDLAERYMQADNFCEAVKIYRALSEVIAENMDNVDDSDGYYGSEFDDALENFAECINKMSPEHEFKKKYIKYLFDKYIEDDPDYFRENYESALIEISISPKDLRYWKKLLKKHLPDDLPDRKTDWSKYYVAKELISMELYILDKLNENNDFYELAEKYYRRDHDFCLLYAGQLERDGKVEQAIKVAEEGVSLFESHLTKGLKKFLNKFYETRNPEKYKNNLKNLFLMENNWEYYEKLKGLCSGNEWKKFLSEILSSPSLSGGWGINRIDIYLQEKMFEDALSEVLKAKDIEKLSRYHKNLANRFPEEYFNAYKELIFPFANSRMGRPHYRRIVHYLEKMKSIKGFDKEFRGIVKKLKEKYFNRPAFLDEMSKI